MFRNILTLDFGLPGLQIFELRRVLKHANVSWRKWRTILRNATGIHRTFRKFLTIDWRVSCVYDLEVRRALKHGNVAWRKVRKFLRNAMVFSNIQELSCPWFACTTRQCARPQACAETRRCCLKKVVHNYQRSVWMWSNDYHNISTSNLKGRCNSKRRLTEAMQT